MMNVKYLFPLFIIASTAWAQDHERGRLPDGRPYRIDKEGLQLADYIAELEVANDDLKRQVIALEDELDAKAKVPGSKTAGPVREHDLTPSKALPPAQKDDTSLCEAKLKELSDKIARQQPQALPICDYESAHNPYFSEAKSLREQLARNPKPEAYDNEKAKRIDLEDTVAKLESDLEAARAQLSAKNAELGKASDDTSHLRQELSDARASAAVTAPREESARASLAPATATEALQKSVREPEAKHPSITDERKTAPAKEVRTSSAEDLASARAEFNEQLAKLQSLVTQRKNMHDSLKSHGKGVSINLRPLVSENGKSLDTYRSEVAKLRPDTDLAELRSGLAQIVLVLNEDIDVLQRLTK